MKIKILLSVLCVGVLMFSCKKEVPQPDEKPYLVNVNPTSPHIMKTVKEDGTVVNYYGKKDETGKTEQIQLVSIKGQDQTKADLLYFNADNQLSRIKSADGETYRFDWTSATSFRLTATSADNSHQVSIPVDISDFELTVPENHKLTPTFQKSKAGSQIKNNASRAGKAIMELRPMEKSNTSTSIQNRDGNRDIQLHLSRCGEPIPAEEYALYPLEVTYCTPCQGNEILLPQGSTNIYTIPEKTIETPADIADICNSISEGLGYVCSAVEILVETPGLLEVVCGAIQAYTPPGTFLLCENIFRRLNNACIITEEPIPGTISALEAFCELIEYFESEGDPETIQLSLPYSDGTSNYVELPYNGPFGDVYLDIPGGETIENLAINPVDPAPAESYIATASIHCAAGQLVSISVVGTDGYTDSNAFIAQGSMTIYLAVPGAEYGVQDLITVEIANGPQLVTSIVF